MQSILVVEDDKTIAMGLEYSLSGEGFQVILAETKAAAQQAIANHHFDLLLLDLGLPDGSGYEVCQFAKAQKEVPVIFLTANDDEVNVVMGLDMGADDYITKPFRIRELISRIKSVLRRYGSGAGIESKAILSLGDIKVNTTSAKVFKGQCELLLTALEYRLLLVFLQNIGQILTREQLLEGIWDIGSDFVTDNTLTVYIKRLREKIEEDPQHPVLIQTVRGVGYRAGG